MLRSDLEYERFDTPRPRLLWELLTDPTPAGPRPRRSGSASRCRTARCAGSPLVDPLELRIPGGAADPPPVALFPVEDPVPIVRTAPATAPGGARG